MNATVSPLRNPATLATARRAIEESVRDRGAGGTAAVAPGDPRLGAALLALLDGGSEHRRGGTRAPAASVGPGDGADAGDRSRDAAAAETVTAFRARFADSAGDAEAFHATLRTAFGDAYDRDAAEGIRQRTLAGDFSWMPTIEVVSGASLTDRSGTQTSGTALGAYAAGTDTVYLSAELLASDPERALEILTEEVGHALDVRLNVADTVGDEGELFALLAAGHPPSPAELEALRAENDAGTILVGGREIEVEYGCNPIKAVVDGVRSVGRAIDDHVIQPTVGLIEDGADIVANTVDTAVDIGQTLWSGTRDIGRNVFRGDFGAAWDGVKGIGKDTWEHVRGYAIETAAMGLHAVANYVDGTLGLAEFRGLRAEEETYLRTIYGDSLDYDAIRIQEGGGLKDLLGTDPHAVGNDIYLPKSSFGANGQLTPDGLELLSHEVAHSWQFQHGGPEYISDAILSYIDDRPAAYDYEKALDELIPWDDLTPDQQAEFAKVIGMALARSPTGTLDVNSLGRALADEQKLPPGTVVSVSVDQLAYVEAIRQRLLTGDL